MHVTIVHFSVTIIGARRSDAVRSGLDWLIDWSGLRYGKRHNPLAKNREDKSFSPRTFLLMVLTSDHKPRLSGLITLLAQTRWVLIVALNLSGHVDQVSKWAQLIIKPIRSLSASMHGLIYVSLYNFDRFKYLFWNRDTYHNPLVGLGHLRKGAIRWPLALLDTLMSPTKNF